MAQPIKSGLAWAHNYPPPLPEGVDPDRSVLIRYDGAKIDNQDVFFAVLDKEDLTRLSRSVLEDIEFSRIGPDGEPRGSSEAFFVGSERRLHLYVDIDRYPDFIDRVRESAEEAGLTVLNGHGDLVRMQDEEGDVVAPVIPAFVENGMGHVPSTIAMNYVGNMRDPGDPDATPQP